MAWDETSINLCINGGAVQTGLLQGPFGLPVGVTRMTIGYNNGAVANGWIRKANYYPRKLTSAELQAATS